MALPPGNFKRGKYSGYATEALSDSYSGLINISPLQSYLADNIVQTSKSRFERIKRNWKFYLGEHYDKMQEDGLKKKVVNYTKKLVDKSTSFLFGEHLWAVDFPEIPEKEENALPVKQRLLQVWEVNDQAFIAEEMGQMGGVAGDVFIQVTHAETDELGEKLPEDEVGIKINVLNSSYVTPLYHPINRRKLVAVVIQFPYLEKKLNDRGNEEHAQSKTYTQFITAEKIRTFIDSEEIDSVNNILKEINIVHIPNQIVAGAHFGYSDVDALADLNLLLDEKFHDVSEIIDYHGAPTTLIFGAKATQLEKGPRKVWSGLPKDGRVENLKLDGDLPAANMYIDRVRQAMFETGGVPEDSLGKTLNVSNTSGVALQTMYMPLMEHTRRKRLTYGKGIQRINRLIMKLLELKEEIKIPDGVKKNGYRTTITFEDPLPKDRLLLMNIISQELTAGLESRRGALVRLGCKDPDGKLAEVKEELKTNGPIVPVNPNGGRAAGGTPASDKKPEGQKPKGGD